MMTKQHFEAIAGILKPYNSEDSVSLPREREYAEKITLDIADYLESENERFSRMRFFLACGLKLSK